MCPGIMLNKIEDIYFPIPLAPLHGLSPRPRTPAVDVQAAYDVCGVIRRPEKIAS